MDYKKIIQNIKGLSKDKIKLYLAILIGVGLFVFAFMSYNATSHNKSLKIDNKELRIKIDSIQLLKSSLIDSLKSVNSKIQKKDLYIIDILNNRKIILQKITNYENEKTSLKSAYFNSDTMQRVRLWAKLTKESK